MVQTIQKHWLVCFIPWSRYLTGYNSDWKCEMDFIVLLLMEKSRRRYAHGQSNIKFMVRLSILIIAIALLFILYKLYSL